jgi:hypothetical protein
MSKRKQATSGNGRAEAVVTPLDGEVVGTPDDRSVDPVVDGAVVAHLAERRGRSAPPAPVERTEIQLSTLEQTAVTGVMRENERLMQQAVDVFREIAERHGIDPAEFMPLPLVPGAPWTIGSDRDGMVLVKTRAASEQQAG